MPISTVGCESAAPALASDGASDDTVDDPRSDDGSEGMVIAGSIAYPLAKTIQVSLPRLRDWRRLGLTAVRLIQFGPN